MSDEDELIEDTPVDPYEGTTDSAADGIDEEPPPVLADDPLVADVPDDEAAGTTTTDPLDGVVAEEDLEPTPEQWSALDPEAVDLPDADESEATIADEVDALDDYDPLAIAPAEDLPEPPAVKWDSYEVQARDTESLGDFFPVAATDDPDATGLAVTTLEPGKTYELRVRGLKADGTTSAWSDTETIVLPVDQIPPPQPSAPVVVGVPGGFVVSHDGLTSAGDNQPADYAHTVLWSRQGTATPIIVDKFTGAFNITYNSLEIVQRSWWVTTVDKAGNASTKSAEVSGQPSPLVDDASIRSALDDAQAAIDDASAAAQAELAVLDGRLSTAEGDLSDAAGRLSSAEAGLDELFPRVGAAESGVSAASSAADAAAAAAAQAQADADAAQALADQLVANAGNLAPYGDLEGMSGPLFPHNADEARSGVRAFTKVVGSDQGYYLPAIPISGGNWYRISFWIKSDRDLTVSAGMPCTFYTADGVMRNVQSLWPLCYRAAHRGPLTPGVWKQVSTLWQAPAEYEGQAVTQLLPRFHVWGPASDHPDYGATVWMDDFVLQDVTAAKDALDAAAEAQAAAQAAHAAAGAAQATADSALTMAGSKTRAYYSTAVPSGTGSAGDVWRRVDAAKDVIGEWYWADGGWQKSQITTEQISNLDVGKLTVGTGVISTLVAQHIAAQSAQYIQLDVKNLTVTGTGTMTEAVLQKLWADGIAAYTASLARATIAAPNLFPELDAPDLATSLTLQQTVEIADRWNSSTGKAIRFTPAGNGRALSEPFEVKAGDQIRIKARYGRSGGTAADGGTWYLGVYRYASKTDTANGVSFGPYLDPADHDRTGSANWGTEVDGVVTIPAEADRPYARVVVRYDAPSSGLSTAHTTVYDITATRLTDGTLIADNSITAPKITASEELSAKVAQFLTVKANHLDANEIWANSAWLGQAKFESEVSGNRVLINSDGIELGSTSSPAGITIKRDGITAQNGNAAERFRLDQYGNISMYGATITAGQLRTATSGRRVTVDNNGITTYNEDGSVQSRLGSNQYGNSLAIRSPDGMLKEIGPHIYGSKHFSGLTNNYTNMNPGTATAYGTPLGNTPSQGFQAVSQRYRVEMSFYFRGMVDAQGQSTSLWVRLVPANLAGTALSGSLLSRYIIVDRSPIYDTFCYVVNGVEELPASVAPGDWIRMRWEVRARNFATTSAARPQITDVSYVLTPA